jgi:GAF domain-containing protein
VANRDGPQRATKQVISDAARAVERSSTPQEAVSAIGRILGAHWPADRVSLRVLLDQEEMLEVVAVWSHDKTAVSLGTRMHALATSFPEVLKSGVPVIVEDGGKSGLAGSVLTTEGIRSWVTAPLRDGFRIVGLISISSKTTWAFRRTDIGFFTEFAAAIETQLSRFLATFSGEKRGGFEAPDPLQDIGH